MSLLYTCTNNDTKTMNTSAIACHIYLWEENWVCWWYRAEYSTGILYFNIEVSSPRARVVFDWHESNYRGVPEVVFCCESSFSVRRACLLRLMYGLVKSQQWPVPSNLPVFSSLIKLSQILIRSYLIIIQNYCIMLNCSTIHNIWARILAPYYFFQYRYKCVFN